MVAGGDALISQLAQAEIGKGPASERSALPTNRAPNRRVHLQITEAFGPGHTAFKSPE
jgi:hypothetical protein